MVVIINAFVFIAITAGIVMVFHYVALDIEIFARTIALARWFDLDDVYKDQYHEIFREYQSESPEESAESIRYSVQYDRRLSDNCSLYASALNSHLNLDFYWYSNWKKDFHKSRCSGLGYFFAPLLKFKCYKPILLTSERIYEILTRPANSKVIENFTAANKKDLFPGGLLLGWHGHVLVDTYYRICLYNAGMNAHTQGMDQIKIASLLNDISNDADTLTHYFRKIGRIQRYKILKAVTQQIPYHF